MASYEGQITLINIHDGAGTPGAPGPTYMINTNQDEVLRFANVSSGFSFSPEELNIQVLKFSESESEILDINFDNVLLYLYHEDQWIGVDWASLGDCVSLENKTITLSLVSLARITDGSLSNIVVPLISAETAFKIEFYADRILAGVKIIGIRYGLSADMARLSLNAEGLVASIQEAGLIFNSNGLTVKNGAFTILADNYIPVQISNFAEEDYYIYTQNGYQLVDKTEGVVQGQQYFILEKERVLEADENGNLKITGIINAKDGQFSGKVYASEGYFNGTINATGGKFSNMITVEGQLVVGQEDKIYIGAFEKDGRLLEGICSENFLKEGDEGFCLYPDGSIIANTIELGEGAAIKNYLRLGESCYLYNPFLNQGRFIAVEKEGVETLSLDDEGILRIGSGTNIILNGPERRISTSNFLSGFSGWSISPDKAEFNNITVRGTIESSVMAHGKIQTVGGILLVRPSAIIKGYQKTTTGYIIYPETQNAGFSIGDYCQIGNQGALYAIVDYSVGAQGEEIVLVKAGEQMFLPEIILLDEEEENASSIIGEILVSYGSYQPPILDEDGKVVTEEKYSIGIAINSSDNSASVAPNAISVFKNVFTADENGWIKFTKEPVIVLGEMSGEGYGGLKGYGLYADNVYLKGSLISEKKSEGEESFYSGINTHSKIKMPSGEQNLVYFPDKQRGDILFWAGAKSSNQSDIAAAPFKVDSYGNLYAGSGFFNGTIISNATITAARIKAAVIEGWSLEDNTSAALSIIDVEKAINFQKRTYDENGNEVLQNIMTLQDDGMTLSVPLKIGNFIVDPETGGLQVDNFFAQDSYGNKAALDIAKLTFLKYRGNSSTLVKTVIKADIENQPSLQFHVMNVDGEENLGSQVLELTQDRSYFYNEVQYSSNVLLGSTVEYRQALNEQGGIIGYDLDVKE